MVQAHSTDRRWSRALQHEHSLRLELQDNMVALANQMQGMEDEARKKLHVQGPFARNTLSGTQSSPESPINSGASSLPENGITKADSKVKLEKKVVLAEEPDGYWSSEDEDKFFDAPEMSPEQWDKASSATGHKRNISGVSVNELQAILNEEPCSTDILPVTSDRKMSVSASFLIELHVSYMTFDIPLFCVCASGPCGSYSKLHQICGANSGQETDQCASKTKQQAESLDHYEKLYRKRSL